MPNETSFVNLSTPPRVLTLDDRPFPGIEDDRRTETTHAVNRYVLLMIVGACSIVFWITKIFLIYFDLASSRTYAVRHFIQSNREYLKLWASVYFERQYCIISRARLVLGWVTVSGSTPSAGNLSQSNLQPRSTQPGHPSMGRRSENRPKTSDAVRMGSKGRYGSCLVAGKIVCTLVSHVSYLSALEAKLLRLSATHTHDYLL